MSAHDVNEQERSGSQQILPQIGAQVLQPGIVEQHRDRPARQGPASSRSAAATLAPEEKPAKMPSSRASRRAAAWPPRPSPADSRRCARAAARQLRIE